MTGPANRSTRNRDARASLLEECGLTPFVLPWRDAHWLAAIGAALPVWAALGAGVAGPLYLPVGLVAWLAFLLWQPLVEELVFRGILQGQLPRIVGARRIAGISTANWLSSLAFSAMHLFAQPPAWALAVLVPSLVFGHLRERFDSVWPAVLTHAVYNAGFAIAAIAAR